MTSATPLVIREQAAAQLLGVSVATLRRWRHERRGPAFVRLGRCVGYRPSDLDSYLATNSVTPTSGARTDEVTPKPELSNTEVTNGR